MALAAIGGALVAGIGNLLTMPLSTPESLHLVQRAAGSLLLALGVVQVLISCARVPEGHWQLQSLAPYLTIEILLIGLLPLGAGSYLLFGGASEPVLAALAVPLAVACLVFGMLEGHIGWNVAEGGKRFITRAIAGSQLPRCRGSLLDALRHAREDSISGALIWLLTVPAGQLLSRMRLLMALVLVFATLGVAEAPVLAELGVKTKPDARQPAHHRPGANRPETSRDDPPPSTSSGPTPAPRVQPAARHWDDICPSEPGAGAPDPTVKQHLHALYLGLPNGGRLPGTNVPPGASAGCTGPVVTIDAAAGAYYTIGTDPQTGRMLSIAVDSAYGPALFLSPAAQPVLNLIRRYGALGGSRRSSAGHGDYYLVTIAAGDVVLLRPQLQDATYPQLAQRYTELMPAAALAWSEAMRMTREWLWPEAHRQANGRVTYRLVRSVVAHDKVATIVYDPASQTAFSAVNEQVRRYRPGDGRVAHDDVETLARTAR